MSNKLEDEKFLQREMNPKTIQSLENKGCDLNDARSIMNVFYVNSEEAAYRLIEALKIHQLSVSNKMITPSVDISFRLCLKAEIILLPNIKYVDNMTDICIELARHVEGEYDGWYTEI